MSIVRSLRRESTKNGGRLDEIRAGARDDALREWSLRLL
jgi:hypothetical protein